MPDTALTLLLDFDDQYRRDRQQHSDFLHRRDRHLALEQGLAGHGALAAWLKRVSTPAPATRRHDPRRRPWQRLRLLFVLAGTVLGVITMLGLLYYDGGRRINVTLLIAVALLQALLALLTSSQALFGWQPWRRLFRDGLPRWWPAPDAPAPMLRALQGPLAAQVAHSGGLAFATAAWLTLLTQVVVRDLAFGWSTTLQTSAPVYHDITTGLAWPWLAWLPQAVPSLDLVTQSRYFHAADPNLADPALLGSWWTFLAMLWLCYAVLPRLALLILGHAFLQWRARRLLAHHPGLAAWQWRCRTPWVESGSADTPHPALAQADNNALPPAKPGPVHIRWAGAGDTLPGTARTLVLDAGGSASLEQDQQTLAQAHQAGGPVLLFTRGWEPPTGELTDFLQNARQQWGRTPVQLIPLAAAATPAAVAGPVLAQWQRFVARHNDPALTLAAPPIAAAIANEEGAP